MLIFSACDWARRDSSEFDGVPVLAAVKLGHIVRWAWGLTAAALRQERAGYGGIPPCDAPVRGVRLLGLVSLPALGQAAMVTLSLAVCQARFSS